MRLIWLVLFMLVLPLAISSAQPVDGDFDNVVQLNDGTTTGTQLGVLIDALIGSVLVRPTAGQTAVVISWGSGGGGGGSYELRANTTVYNVAVKGSIDPGADSTLWSVTSNDTDGHRIYMNGSNDNVVIRDSVFSGGAGAASPFTGNIYQQNYLFRSDNVTMTDNTFRNYANTSGPGHSEAWYIGEQVNNLEIRDNIFDNNGTTAHLFFTWWDCDGGTWNSTAIPPCNQDNVCVAGNTFSNVIGGHDFDVQRRSGDTPPFDSTNMTFEMDQVSDHTSGFISGVPATWEGTCPSTIPGTTASMAGGSITGGSAN